jgi:hypothetical protein
LSRKNAIGGSCAACLAASRNVVNLPFQGRFLPVMQRVSEWQALSVTHCEISRDAS